MLELNYVMDNIIVFFLQSVRYNLYFSIIYFNIYIVIKIFTIKVPFTVLIGNLAF